MTELFENKQLEEIKSTLSSNLAEIVDIITISFKNDDVTNLYCRARYDCEFTIGSGTSYECYVGINNGMLIMNTHLRPNSECSFNLSPEIQCSIWMMCDKYKVHSDNQKTSLILEHLKQSPYTRNMRIDKILQDIEL